MNVDQSRDPAGLARELADLRRENERLRRLLKLTDAEAEPAVPAQAAWFERDPGPVDVGSSPAAKIAFYLQLFAARTDVYAVRWENRRSGRSGWLPAVAGGWRKGRSAGEQRYLPLTQEVLAAHLTGSQHIGLYPMLPGDQTQWLAADFDGQAAMLDALAYLKAARAVGAPAALEVSRSGVGAHVWIFFTDPIPAGVARQLGTGLVREALAIRGRMDLRAYDRLFPSQDTLTTSGIGNLIAAPLHGRSRRDGTTVFLDLATLEPYQDQWAYLSTLDRLAPRQASRLAAKHARGPVVGARVDRNHPARSTRTQPRSAPVVKVRLGAGVAFHGDDLAPSVYATLRHAASMANPEFAKRQRLRLSTWDAPRFIHSYDETLDGDLVLPRGLLDTARRIVEDDDSRVEVEDSRVSGAAIDLAFTASLTPDQEAAVRALESHDLGVLVAPPGTGKTVIACALVARRERSTLVLVDRKALADQWRRQVQDLLGVKPGQLGGGRAKTRGTVDILTLQTLARRDDLGELLAGYGMVVVDECHHLPAAAFDFAVKRIPARWWLGLTATPYRRDGLDDLIHLQLGPERHRIEPPVPGTLAAAHSARPMPVLEVHATGYRYVGDADPSRPGGMAAIYRDLVADEARLRLIVADIVDAHRRGRHCLVLTQWTSHVDRIDQALADHGLDAVVLKGGLTVAAKAEALAKMDPGRGPILAVATGSYVGEGFDCPALDTLFLAAPIAFKGRLVQYVGRVLRAYPGKEAAEVHDYHDVDTPVLATSLAKRAPGYVSLGFADPRRSR
ncbi:MAG: helicase [Propionibacteriales bacterium]|nr:helicase [Propionibacteriales bacterium]